MEYRVLGPLDVRAGDGALPLGGAKQRALLALLLVNANRVVSRERLIDELWGDHPPQTAVTSVQVYVSRLRKLLPADALQTRPPGYLLATNPDDVDLLRFDRLVAEARTAEPERASRLLREALDLWRGPALKEFDEPFFRIEGGRLDDLRLAALEDRIEADLALGRHRALTGELEVLIAEHPHRERLRGQLMLALYRAGRQADALAAFRDTRSALDEVGVEPSAALKQLERQILIQDATLDLPRDRLLTGSPGESLPLPGPLVPTSPFPFVGRTAEVSRLRALLEASEQGEGAFVLLTGEAGAGKTRLLRELASSAAGRGVLVLYGASDAAVSTPYQPLREWLEFLLRVSEPDALRESLGSGGEALARLVPELAPLTGSPASASGEAESDRYLLQRAAADTLTRISRVQPVLLVSDDLQWSDAETLHLLRRLARVVPELRMLVIAAFRDPGEEIPPELADTLADLSRLEAMSRLALGNLGTDDVREFIRASTDADVSEQLASEIAELTEGVPLLLCELWRDLRESGAVEVTRAVRVSEPLAELRGPRRIRDVVQQRLARLAPETGTAVETAAVAGPRSAMAVLGEAAGLEPERLLPALDEAAAAGLLEALPDPIAEWRFTHELVRRAVYDRLTRTRRAELHLRVGEALERAHADDPSRVLPELAHHFTLAAPLTGVERAVAYNLRAAEAASASGADEESATRLSTALQLGIAEPRQRARVQVDLAYLLGELRRPEAAALFAAGLEAATNLGDRALALHVRLQQTHTRLLRDPAFDPTEAETVTHAAIETFREIGDERELALAERRLGMALLHQGRVEEECDVLERALVHADASGDPRARRMVIASLVHALFNGPAPVVDAIRRCDELLDSSRHDRVLEATITRGLSALVAMAGRFDEAGELVRKSSLVLDELNLVTRSVYRLIAATAKELIGDRVGAEHELEAAWQALRDIRPDSVDARAMSAACDLAQLYCDEGRWEDAERCLDYGRDVDEVRFYHGIRRLAASARVAAHRGEHTQALDLAQRGVALAERSDLLNLRARLWLALAEVQRHAGAEAEARTAVAAALALYERKGNVAAAAIVRASQ